MTSCVREHPCLIVPTKRKAPRERGSLDAPENQELLDNLVGAYFLSYSSRAAVVHCIKSACDKDSRRICSSTKRAVRIVDTSYENHQTTAHCSNTCASDGLSYMCTRCKCDHSLAVVLHRRVPNHATALRALVGVITEPRFRVPDLYPVIVAAVVRAPDCYLHDTPSCIPTSMTRPLGSSWISNVTIHPAKRNEPVE